MANICKNELRVYSEDPKNLEYINDFITNNLEISDIYEDAKDISMVCLSVEWGNFYSAFHTCDSEGWCLE